MCLLCPLNDDCRGRSRAENFPVKTRVETIRREETIAILRKDGKIYAEQVPEGRPWHGLWRFPDFDPARMNQGEPLAQLRYGITRYAVTMQAVAAQWKARAPRTGRYLTLEEAQSLAFATPHRKLLTKICRA
jgi:A/G-specific adenine glycosylase